MRAVASRATFTPKDRSKREHTARVDRVVWTSDDDTRVILRLKDGASAIGPGSADQFLVNQQYRFLGRWIDGQRGTDFHFDTFIVDTPHFATGVVKYLGDICRGVGNKTALALWDAFHEDAIRTLREEPMKVAGTGIMTVEGATLAAEDLKKYAHLEKTRVDLFGIFAGRGFPSRLIDAAIGKYGVTAPDRVRKSPFRLMIDRLPGCGFRRVDKLFLDTGGKATALKRQALAGWDAFKEDRTGSTWLDAADCVSQIEKLIPGRDCEPVRALKLLVRAGWCRVRRDGDKRYIAVREKADAEARVAAHVRRLRRSSPLWPTDLPVSREDGDGLPSVHQVSELRAAIRDAIGAFTGGPGTGKTHTLAYLLRAIIRDYGRDSVCVCAPTGKAAVRASESLRNLDIDIRATTIHQLLEIGKNGHEGQGWGFLRNERRPLDFQFIVVDETSMVDTSLLGDLLGACGDGSHVLLIGDTFQLPPVGHGAPLRDLIAGGLATGQLSEVRRNAGTVVRTCQAIKAGTPIIADKRLELDSPDPANLLHVECSQQQAATTLDDVLASITRFDRRWETQIIVGLNDKSDVSRKKLNARLGATLNPDGREARGNPFKVGDKVICRRNQRIKTYAPSSRSLPPSMAGDADAYIPTPWPTQTGDLTEWYVANGEIGRVVAVSAKGSIVRFGGIDVPLCWVSNGKKRTTDDEDGADQADGGSAGSASKDDFELAWAITVHGSQGSEWPLVICMIDDAASTIADRNYWYTAISRARRACVVIGPRGTLDKQVAKKSIDRRRTFLAELVKVGQEEESTNGETGNRDETQTGG